MTTHTIAIARHTAQVVGLMGVLVLGTWDSYGTEQLLLRHGPEWEGLAIDATFHNVPNDEGVTVLADTDGLVTVPPEACMRASKYATITFRGVQDGVQRISCNLPYMVLDHAQVPGANSTATPSENAQALAQMQDLRDGAVDAKNQAEAARDGAANSATAAASSAVAAAGSAAQAEAQKTAAAKSASDAQGYMQTASGAATAAKTSEDAAAKSAADADSTANSINNSMMQIAANKEAVRQLKEDLADKVPKKDYAPETKTESMTQPVGKDENGKLWTTPGSVFAVSSVNGKTGAVVLTADDVHAMRDDTVIPTVPKKVSAFENDAGYLTAHQDISGKLDADKLPEAINTALAQAKASGEFDGTDGADGGYYSPSITQPDENTMRVAFTPSDSSMPEAVSMEVTLPAGADGKSAYQYAVEAGYTGTEAEFAAKLANECIDQTARDYAAAANARIDLFTSLEAGSTTGDAELQDIRIGFDGKSYDSAGSAVRGQAEALKNSLDFMSEEEGETTTTTVRNPAVTNLLDGVNLTNNMSVNTSGVETASTNYSLTDYIPIKYNHYLTYLRSTRNGYDAIGMVAFYDGNKNFIKRLSEYNGDVYTARVAYQQIASTNNAGYVRFCIGKNADRPSLIVTDGDTREKSISDYNNYYITITEFTPTGRSVTKLKDGVVTPEKTSFLRKSRNVLDDSNLKFGFVESDGSISDSKFYKYTDKCAVIAGSTLRFRAGDTYQGVRKIAFYNNETLLNVLSYGGYSNYVRSCTVPATATHAVFCIGRAMDKKMVIDGDSYPDEMQEYGVYKLDSQQLPTPADYIRAKGIGINNGIPGGWCKTQASVADLSLASTLNYTDYISEIDAIASDHSDYVAVTSPGNDATNTYPVKYYTLVPPGDRNYMRKPIPTVIVIGGIHGGESAGAYAVRTLFVDLCENYLKDERLNYLHNNVRFIIFPVANPYGFGGTYKNGNGVNLNRNFSYGWDDASYESSDKLYGGASAFSEAEAKYIKSVIDNNQNVLCVLDIHSNNDAALNSQWRYVNWLSMCTDIQSDALENAALNQIQGLTMRLYAMGKITEEDGVCGYTSHTSGQGMCKSYAASKGIWALTAEGCAQLPSDTASYSKDVQRINAEMVENLVVNILRCASARADDR